MASETRLSIDLVGFNDTMRALRQVDEVAYKAMRKSIRKIAEIVASDARSRVNSSLPHARNWRSIWPQKFPPWTGRKLTRGDRGWPAFNIEEMRSSIKVSFRRSRLDYKKPRAVRASVAVRSNSAALTIYEFGKRSHRSKNFPYVNSIPFVNAMGSKPGGRVMWPAFEDNKDTIRREILAAVKQIESVTQAGIDKAKDR